MPIYKLIDEMTYEELLGWYDYFDRRPIEWRADDRAFKLLQAQGVKGKSYELFPSLGAIYNAPKEEKEGTDMSTLKGSALFQNMLKAQGGDTLDL
jgi:hypothetical protein